MSTSINSYESRGWSVSNRTDNHVTLTKKSSRVEVIARSVAYTVAFPVVFGLSIVPASLTLVVVPCCCIMMAAQARNEGNFSTGDTFDEGTEEACSGVPAARCLININKGFYDWVKPYQSINKVKVIRTNRSVKHLPSVQKQSLHKD